jgi:predicted transglutaminase-like cysteine proteinase
VLRSMLVVAVLALGLAPVSLTPAENSPRVSPASPSPAAPASVDAPRAERIEGIAQFPKWTDMLRRWSEQVAAAQNCVVATDEVQDCVPGEWASLTAQLRPLDRHAVLDQLNRVVNRHPYVAATDNWGRVDYWETPFEFMSRNGQCEDYAIAKFMILRALGFADDDLRILVVRDVVRQVDHAVLVVNLDGTAWMLDSLDDIVAPLASATQYRPYYAINETGWWLYTPNPLQLASNALSR